MCCEWLHKLVVYHNTYLQIKMKKWQANRDYIKQITSYIS